jgi:D-inositol-3-phosphate glycosyltransferase
MKRLAMISVHECPLASSEGKERGGINVYVFELAKALSRIGWQIDIYTRLQDDVNPKVVEVTNSMRVIHIPCGPHTPLSKKLILSHIEEFSQGVSNFMQKENLTYDILHAHYYLSGIVAQTLANALPHVPWVMTFHTLGLMKQLVSQSSILEDPKDRVQIEKTLAQSAIKIVTTSAYDKEYVAALYSVSKDRIQTIPPGVDTTLFRPQDREEAKKIIGANPDHHIVLAVGRIDPVKGFDVLLYAIKMLFAKQPDMTSRVCLWIVGGDIEEDKKLWSKELKKLTVLQNTLGLSTTVKFVPAQPQEKLVHYYNAADVVVMPSHYESFGMVALEALACDIPVITTDVMGISPMLKEFPKGHVISANNPVLLSEQLEHVLTEHHGYYTNEHTMQKFTWDTVARQVSKLYESCIQSS